MDEFTSIAIWFFIVIVSLNMGIIYLNTTGTFADPSTGLSPQITKNTFFESFTYDVSSSTSGNEISSGENDISGTWLTDMINFALKVGNSIRIIFTAWTDLLSFIFSGIPGGQFFANVIFPLIGVAQMVGFFIVGVRVAGVIRGVV
jgi:hypothetical protein